MTGFKRQVITCAALLVIMNVVPSWVFALDWITLAPNPSYSRDLAMGASTVALSYAPQSQSINPAGLVLFRPQTDLRGSLFLNPGGAWHIDQYWEHTPDHRTGLNRALDHLRLLAAGGAVQIRIATVAMLLSQPVMLSGDTTRYNDYRRRIPLEDHQNSLQIALALHSRVAIGGRADRYYRFDIPDGEAFSYGVILQPRDGIRLGIQYQRFPESGPRLMHPLDRRSDQTTTAGLAVSRSDLTASIQVMNLTESDKPAFLEPHAGIEWRAARAVAIRAGGTQYSRSHCWAWTTGLGFIDANWFKSKKRRILVPDDLLQIAVAVIYDRRTPIMGMSSLTLAWRF